MLPNERFALNCLQRYAENGDIVDASNGQFAHCPQPERYGDKGYYLTWEDHQHQGLLQSKDVGECCFFVGHAKKWLLECDPLPENYFELWDIYDEYVRKQAAENAKKMNEVLHAEKDENGKSRHSVSNAKKMLEKMHKEKNEEGKSVQGVKNAGRLNKEKNKEGKSVNAVKGAVKLNELLHKERNEEGKSTHAVSMGKKGSKKTNNQTWESKVDGFRSNAGTVARHNKSRGWDPSARVQIS